VVEIAATKKSSELPRSSAAASIGATDASTTSALIESAERLTFATVRLDEALAREPEAPERATGIESSDDSIALACARLPERPEPPRTMLPTSGRLLASARSDRLPPLDPWPSLTGLEPSLRVAVVDFRSTIAGSLSALPQDQRDRPDRSGPAPWR
jgi:hypothetical protein